MSSHHSDLLLSTKKLVALERSGCYEDALAAFGPGWNEEGFLPETTNGTTKDQAEALLRFAALIGFDGYRNGVEGSQERSKNLLTRALDLFEECGEVEKIVECENYIAIAYWRSNDPREARVWVETALARNVPSTCDARLYACVTKSMILLSEGKAEESVEHCLAVEAHMRKHGDAFLNGSLCTNLALSLKLLSRNTEAVEYLKSARYFHTRSHHKTYLGTVHNNLAQLFNAERKFVSAHESADAAIKLYRKIKDRTREASTLDTKAQIYLEERKLTEGLDLVDRSIALLASHKDSEVLAESYFTRARILLFLDRFSDSVLSLVDCLNITRIKHGDDAAKALIEVYDKTISEKQKPAIESQPLATDELELILPESLAGYDDYKGVWINTDKLESVGVPRGSLAIVTPIDVKRGDLAAIMDLKNQVVSCGFYDSDFGIVCLESSDHEPELFDASEIKVLGKIVGVCRSGKDPDGKMLVEALAF